MATSVGDSFFSLLLLLLLLSLLLFLLLLPPLEPSFADDIAMCFDRIVEERQK